MAFYESLFVGKNLLRFESVDSTNAVAAKLLAEKKLPEGTVIITSFQSAGKGTSGNSWQSEEGKNILLSVVLYPSFLSPRLQFFLNQISSLAVSETVESFLPHASVNIKWPNDVFADDKKIAGILIENSVQGQKIQHTIMGIGMNVNQEKFGSQLLTATSLAKIGEKEFLLEEVMQALFSNLEKRFLQLSQNKIETIQKDYMKKLYRIEQECLYKAGGKRFNANIVGLTAEGKLILQRSDRHEVYGFKEVEMVL